jgi:hypothetical protein
MIWTITNRANRNKNWKNQYKRLLLRGDAKYSIRSSASGGGKIGEKIYKIKKKIC